jgi:hypothetical protein
MPIWAEKALVEVIEKYKNIPISENNIDKMREEFIALGLESLMPLAIKGVFER